MIYVDEDWVKRVKGILDAQGDSLDKDWLIAHLAESLASLGELFTQISASTEVLQEIWDYIMPDQATSVEFLPSVDIVRPICDKVGRLALKALA